MADARINIKDSNKIKIGIDTIKESDNKLKEGKANLDANPFAGLTTEPDFLSKYLKNYQESIVEVLNFSTKIQNALSAYINEKGINPERPGGPSNNRRYPGGGSGPGQVTPPIGDVKPPKVSEEEDKKIRQIAGEKANLVSTKTLENMKLSTFDKTLGELIKLAEAKKQKLDEYAHDLSNADEIKDYLLKSNLIPQEFKELIKNADSQTVRELFEQILRGERPELFALNTVNLGIVYKYLLDVAQKNNISVEELLSNPNHQKLLQDTLAKFKNVVELFEKLDDTSPEQFQEQLLNMYDGNVDSDKIDENSVNTVRSMVDFISEETGIKYEELLTDKGYAKTLKGGVMDFAKSTLFLETCSHYTDKGMRDTMSNLFNGNNLKAFGIDEAKVNEFKKEIDSLAQKNNTTAEKLLTSKEYEDQVKEGLGDSKSLKGVGSIFKDAKPEVSQKVAKNIYDKQFKSKTTDDTILY